ncbi:MAG TPA: BamA/TamA family outer membrane protein [Haliangiales bacterium]|nr:BamA/TamA family outer membrane protein [Haliangiales bacterium]
MPEVARKNSARAAPIVAVAVWAWAAAAPVRAADAPTTEVGIVPLVGGDSDNGIGFGALSTVARLDPAARPYEWKVDAGAFISFKVQDRTLVVPYLDAYFEVTIPQFLSDRLRLDVRPSFTRETTQRYFGLGNASPAPDPIVPARDQYARVHPSLRTRLRLLLAGQFFWEVGASYTENWLDIDPASTLAMQMSAGTPVERDLLGTAEQHAVLLIDNSIQYDSRETEVSTYHGHFHQLKLRYSPRMGAHFPHAYTQLNLITRSYLVVAGPLLRLDVRGVIDVQLGDVPFYEMARYEDTFAFGGGNGVRGVPGQRYYGRVKAFANIELRSRLARFQIGGKDYALGSALFFDFGRLWADLASNPDLDGTGLGLKYGVGGGLRLQQGETFVVRADVAWSPDARPIGAYVAAGQAF